MKDIYLKAMRRVTWVMIFALFAYVFISSFFEPSKAKLLSETQGNQPYMEILWVNGYAAVPCMLLVMVAIVCYIGYFTMRKTLTARLKDSLLCLADFILAAGIWVLTDSHFLSFVTDNKSVVALISYMSFTTMFAFLFQFIYYVSNNSRNLYWLCVGFYVISLLQILYFVYPVIPINLLIIQVHLMCLIGAVAVVAHGYGELNHGSRPEIRSIVRGFLCLAIFGVATMIVYYINPDIHYALIYSAGICVFCGFLIVAALTILKTQIEKEANELAYKKLAYTDVMTGLMNKSAYIEEEKKPLTAGCIYLMMDINNLKKINDSYGHKVGDDVIKAAAGYVKRFFDRGLCYRFGGDEFIVICRDYKPEEIKRIISDMRKEMADDNKNREVPVEIAVGFTVGGEGDTVEDMFQRADRSMYEDKTRQKAGRD